MIVKSSTSPLREHGIKTEREIYKEGIGVWQRRKTREEDRRRVT